MQETGSWQKLQHPHPDPPARWQIEVTLQDGTVKVADSEQTWKDLCRWRTSYRKLEAVYPDHEGVAVWTRPDLARAVHAKAMRAAGIRTLAEVDDNYVSDPKLNLFFKVNNYDRQAQIDHMKAIASQNGVVVTTDWLRDRYHRAFKEQFGTSPPIFVCRNHVDPDQWPDPIPYDGPLRVGYMGSGQHVWDVRLIYPALAWAKENGCKITMIGVDPAGYDKAWGQLGYELIPWIEPKEYRREGLPLDVGFACVLYNDHTLGKSDIKPMELAMSGAACVASNHPLYNRTFKHREHVLFASGKAEFLWAAQELVRDRGLREHLVGNMQAYIREHRSFPVNGLPEWEAALNG
jgi:hypothetical protein